MRIIETKRHYSYRVLLDFERKILLPYEGKPAKIPLTGVVSVAGKPEVRKNPYLVAFLKTRQRQYDKAVKEHNDFKTYEQNVKKWYKRNNFLDKTDKKPSAWAAIREFDRRDIQKNPDRNWITYADQKDHHGHSKYSTQKELEAHREYNKSPEGIAARKRYQEKRRLDRMYKVGKG